MGCNCNRLSANYIAHELFFPYAAQISACEKLKFLVSLTLKRTRETLCVTLEGRPFPSYAQWFFTTVRRGVSLWGLGAARPIMENLFVAMPVDHDGKKCVLKFISLKRVQRNGN